MDTKVVRNFLIILQIIITAATILFNICGIATYSSISKSRDLIESLVRCVATMGFTIFYYASVSDSFSSDNLIFPLYLLFLSASETRIIEIVESVMNLYVVPPRILVSVLVFSTFAIGFCLTGYALLTSSSKRETNIYTVSSIIVSVVIAYYAPIAQSINNTWSSKNLSLFVIVLFAAGILVSAIQAGLETSKSSRVKYIICALLLINNYVNLAYNSITMNFIGTILYIVSLILIVILVRLNSTRL